MESLASLWMPILVSAVVVFVASFLAWMVLPHHRADWKKMPEEDAVLDALRDRGVAAGSYMFPFCAGGADMKSAEFKQRWDRGPHGMLTVWSGPPNMGTSLPLTFVFYLVVSVFVAYLSTLALGDGPPFRTVFRVAGAAGVACYLLGGIPGHIWFDKSMRRFVTNAADNLVYGVLTGLVFAWLWPGGTS